MMNAPQRLLVLEDDNELRAYFCEVGKSLGFEVRDAGDANAFFALCDSFAPHAILLDLGLPGADGVAVLRDLSRRGCKARIVLASGQDTRVLASIQRLGRMQGLFMSAVLQKPVALAGLAAALTPVSSGAYMLEEADLRAAIEEDRIVLHYQPKVALQGSASFPMVGCEALARMKMPSGALLSPNAFVNLAEETGLIEPLGELVMRKVIAQLKQWRDRGVAMATSVNISPSQLGDLSLPDRLQAMLAEARIPPSLLELEVTEQAVMKDVIRATDVLTRLRLKRIAVSLDDFGAGYSSLAEIYRMPFSELKLDRSLVSDTDHDNRAQSVVRAVVSLAKELELTICAEGVETDATAHFLRSIGCERAQGFLFGAPVRAELLGQFGSAGSPAAMEARL